MVTGTCQLQQIRRRLWTQSWDRPWFPSSYCLRPKELNRTNLNQCLKKWWRKSYPNTTFMFRLKRKSSSPTLWEAFNSNSFRERNGKILVSDSIRLSIQMDTDSMNIQLKSVVLLIQFILELANQDDLLRTHKHSNIILIKKIQAIFKAQNRQICIFRWRCNSSKKKFTFFSKIFLIL